MSCSLLPEALKNFGVFLLNAASQGNLSLAYVRKICPVHTWLFKGTMRDIGEDTQVCIINKMKDN